MSASKRPRFLARTSCKSPVWACMEKVAKDQIRCTICNVTFKYYGSTSSLLHHMKTRHPQEFHESQKERAAAARAESAGKTFVKIKAALAQSTMEEASAKGREYQDGSAKKNQLDKLLCEMIATDLQPPSIVEDKGFRKFIEALDPMYKLPSTRQISKTLLPDLHKKEKQKLKEELQHTWVAITTDIWTSHLVEGYITVTAHYIKDWKVFCAVLETAKLSASHTASDIADLLKEVFTAWDIIHRICCVVTDNAASLMTAIHMLNLPHQLCFAHTLNLVVQDSLKAVENVTRLRTKIKDIASFFHHSVKGKTKLMELQTLQGKYPLKLKQEIDSCWTSTYYMLERYLQLHEFVTAALSQFERQDQLVAASELLDIRLYVSILQPFQKAAQEMSNEKYTSLSKVVPMIVVLRQCMASLNMTDTTGLSDQLSYQMKIRVANKEEEYLCGVSTLLDPRFKTLIFSNAENVSTIESKLTKEIVSAEAITCTTLPDLSHSVKLGIDKGDYPQWDSFGKKVKATMSTSVEADLSQSVKPEIDRADESQSQWDSLDPKLKATMSPTLQAGPSQLVKLEEMDSSDKTNDPLWAFLDKKVQETLSSAQTLPGPAIEISRMKNELPLERQKDPLLWWKTMEPVLPKLSPMARKYLTIPATSAPAERLFSKTGEFISVRRSNLKDSTVDSILFLNRRP